VRATHRSLFDGSLQGIALADRPAFGFQGHPEAGPGPHDVASLFIQFGEMMIKRVLAQARGRDRAQGRSPRG
jgi:carbamoyl-phosphate synthase small subunit